MQNGEYVSAIHGERDRLLIIDIEAIMFLAVEQNAAAPAKDWITFEREIIVAGFLEEPDEYETYIWGKFRESFRISSLFQNNRKVS